MYLKEVTQKNKKNGSRTYLQFVESVRTEKGPRQNIVVNIGRIDDKDGRERLEQLTEALLQISETVHRLDPAKDLEGLDAKQLGCNMVFRRLFNDLGLDELLKKVLGPVNTDFDVKDALFNMILNRLSSPSSKNAVTQWQQDQHQLAQYDSHQYYRAMDHLHDHQEELENALYSKMKSHSSTRKKDVSIALFDTTSVVYYGDGDEQESFLNYGFSKARRSDLKQVVVGVAMSANGVPVSHETFSGNTNDVSCFKQMIDKFTQKHGENHATFVGDRGLISSKNIEALVQAGYKYILGFRMRTIPKQDRAALLKKADLKEIKKNLEYRDLEYKGKRLIIYYNQERGEKDRAKREEILERIRDKIKGGTIKSIVSNKDYKKFLNIEGKNPSLDQSKIDADAAFDGVFILTTNTKVKPAQAVSTYRSLWQCEAGFRTLKSELDLQPLYHRKERRIRSHVFLCFIALILKNMLIKKMRAIDKNASYKSTLRDLKRLQAMEIKIHKTKVTIRTEVKEHAKLAIKSLNMAFPKKVLAHHSQEIIALPN